jgi:hypothetical protein
LDERRDHGEQKQGVPEADQSQQRERHRAAATQLLQALARAAHGKRKQQNKLGPDRDQPDPPR